MIARRSTLVFAAILLIAVSSVSAGQAGAGGMPPAGGPGCPGDPGMMGGAGHHHGGGLGGPVFHESLFPPELILRNQEFLGISADQIEALKKLLNETHGRITDLQVDLERATERLRRILDTPRVDEAAALAEAEQIMGYEAQVKKAQMALLIRTKNLLTAEQQNQLADLRAAERAERGSREERGEPIR
jgi:Spy/CpxP family protein refolding chaperone